MGDWATFINRGNEKRDRERRRAALVRQRPWLDDSGADGETVLPWLVEAFDAYTTDEIVALVAEVEDVVLGLEADAIAALKRGHRRRFAALQNKLTAGEGGTEVRLDPDIAEDTAALPAVETQPDPGELLIARVRGHVEGKVTLFISNRDDPHLKEAVERAFGLEIDWCDGSPRKVQSAVSRIERGSYDLVIGVTGFMKHAVERALAPACKGAGVPYARAYRGRTLACAQAIGVALGLE